MNTLLTPKRAADALRYCERMLDRGSFVSDDHRLFLIEKRARCERLLIERQACLRCGRRIQNEANVATWRENGHLGPECSRWSD